MRLISLIILPVEPRASSPDTLHTGDSVPGSTPLTVVGRVYPGWCREVYIPGWCIAGIVGGVHTRVVYSLVYLSYPGSV